MSAEVTNLKHQFFLQHNLSQPTLSYLGNFALVFFQLFLLQILTIILSSNRVDL